METQECNKWNDLHFKDKLSYAFATICFFIGWIITFIAFFVPPVGVVADSILWVLGQSLTFTGAIIGIGQHYNAQTQNFKRELTNFVKDKINEEAKE